MICGLKDESVMSKAGDFTEAYAGMPNEITGYVLLMRRSRMLIVAIWRVAETTAFYTVSCDVRIAQAICNAVKDANLVRVRIAGSRRNAFSMSKSPPLVK